jgi:thiol-disulfide isomerase/thioredoxin
MSRRGYKLGEASVGDTKATVVLSDSNNDAVFGAGDWWELRAGDSPSKSVDMRRVGEFAWLGESAFKLEVDNAFGGSARLVPFDPGMTREADSLARDPYGADRMAVKAAKPLEFRHNVDVAIAEASDMKLPCFIKFETSWCGPCKLMTELVFTAKDVVDASEGVVCVMVDGDARKDLVKRYEVKAYPTGVMLAADGSEAARFVGYQKVTEMAAFLKDKRAKP